MRNRFVVTTIHPAGVPGKLVRKNANWPEKTDAVSAFLREAETLYEDRDEVCLNVTGTGGMKQVMSVRNDSGTLTGHMNLQHDYWNDIGPDAHGFAVQAFGEVAQQVCKSSYAVYQALTNPMTTPYRGGEQE